MKMRWRFVSGLALAGTLAFLAVLLVQRFPRPPGPGAPPAPDAMTMPGRPAAPPAAATASFRLLSDPRYLAPTTTTAAAAPAPAKTNLLAYRLRNTAAPLAELIQSDTAVLLANALIDTASGQPLPIPDHLRSHGDPGSYVVQSRGPLNDTFRKLLAQADATVVAYIPNNAYLVRMNSAGAQELAANPRTQAVLPYEPYYKLAANLLPYAVQPAPLPPEANNGFNLSVFADAVPATTTALNQLGAQVLGEQPSPFGPVLTVAAPDDSLPAMAALPGVQRIEAFHPIVPANDLDRTTLGVSSDSVVTSNYLGLTGSNVLVNVTDTGVDATHPDLANRVTGDSTNSLIDTVGHGTHVAGIIASTGANGPQGTNVSGSVDGASFRGMAPNARIYSIKTGGNSRWGELPSGGFGMAAFYYQTNAAATNAFISNNSWLLGGSSTYDLSAASYDAAVRDALPYETGSHPMLFVFPAGNGGGGDDSGQGGNSDTIGSPGTAKNVITVGALEQLRNITNQVVVDGVTNMPWLAMTDSGDQVAALSSRGNVNPGIEGDAGRFKPDVVAPGIFVVSTRSSQWDTNAYYDPTNHHLNTFFNQILQTNRFKRYSIAIPNNAVAFTITITPSRDPLPDLPIYVAAGYTAAPTNYDVLGTNALSLPPATALVTGTNYSYVVGNYSTQAVVFDITTDVITTNDLGNYLEVLRDLNDSLEPGAAKHYYRYEWGTSMAAAGVSGTLALMQEFFEQRLRHTNSPALMKALLINGARNINSSLYDFQVRSDLNYQGWGVVNLTNSVPLLLASNLPAMSGPVVMFDQSPTNALATAQSHTYQVAVAPAATNQPLRVTLVWTDPPGNPSAGVKLVNDLDLIVTNLTTTNVYYGNDIPAGSVFTQPWNTNKAANIDSVNNVENIYLAPPLNTNYSITVYGRRVNVNAVTANTNDVAQDYALVASLGNGQLTNALTITDTPVFATNYAHITYIQPQSNNLPLLHERVGASTPLIGTNIVTNIVLAATNIIPATTNIIGLTTNVVPAVTNYILPATNYITVGVTNQWNFYVITNSTGYTNVAFLTFNPPDLSVPRIGALQTALTNATRIEADIDLYVSSNPGLTNLDPAAIVAADKSIGPGGTEMVIYSNAAPGSVYYVGVKSEDHMAAEFGFVALFSQGPFSQNGWMQYGPVEIPDGSPEKPEAALLFMISVDPRPVRRVIISTTNTHENFGDLIGILTHNNASAVLNNHNSLGAIANYVTLYDDSRQNDIPGAIPADGPGSLRQFTGQSGAGLWLLTMVDNAVEHTGHVSVAGYIEPQVRNAKGITITMQPNSWYYDFIDVPPDATNLTITLSQLASPVQLYLRYGDFPDQQTYDKSAVIGPPGGSLSLSIYDSPPLRAGRYYYGIFNPNSAVLTFNVQVQVDRDLGGVTPVAFTSAAPVPILDDAVNTSSIFVNSNRLVAAMQVGVRINHPRESDLALTLVSPQGTRILLAEDRGGYDTNGYGSTYVTTNMVPVASSGGPQAATNVIDTGLNSGTITIDYDFYSIPDTLSVIYETNYLFGPTSLSGTGRVSLAYGPGSSSLVTIVVNENGNTNSSTAWDYTVTSTRATQLYATFTDDTSLTTTPIKFAEPPFGDPLGLTNLFISGFEPVAPGDVAAGNPVDGWSVLTNKVTVINDPLRAHTGSQFLSLGSGAIARTLPTIKGRDYRLDFVSQGGAGLDGLVSWWPGEGSPADIVDGNTGTVRGGVTYGTGVVGQAFQFDGLSGYIEIGDKPNLRFTNAMTVEAWIRPVNFSKASNEILSKWAVSGRSYTFKCTPSGQVVFYISADGGTLSAVAVTGNTRLQTNQWVHVAGTYDGASVKVYVNGLLDGQSPWNQGIYSGNAIVGIGANVMAVGLAQSQFTGWIDEPALFNRALTAAEIKAIFDAGAAGKCGMPTPPAVCGASSGAQVFLDGIPTNIVATATNWFTNSITFRAAQDGTTLEIAPLAGFSGVLLDTFTLTRFPTTLYFLPEEALSALVGENAYGEWKLEAWDNRVGATNPQPSILSWQMQFTFGVVASGPPGLLTGTPVTNTIGASQWAYYAVDVPLWARFATNSLLSATAPVNLWFNQTRLPTGTNATDFVLLSGATNGSATLSATNVPPLVPGQRYYLGVYNPNPTNVTFALQVDFDIQPLASGVPMAGVADSTYLPRYFQFDVSTNASAAVFVLTNLSGNVDLVVRKGQPLPTLTSFDYESAQAGTTPESISVLTNSTPVPLTPGRWYLGVFNSDVTNVTYTVIATEIRSAFAAMASLTNGIPYAATNFAVGGNTLDFYRYDVSSNAVRAQFEINGPSGMMTLVARRSLPPLPSLTSFDYLSANGGTNDAIITVTDTSTPVALRPGTWYLAAVNVSGAPVAYTIKATDWPVYGTNNSLTASVGGGDSFCLNWNSLAGAHYFVQGRVSLDSKAWTTLSPTITATGPLTTWCLALPTPYQFFRVVDGVVLDSMPSVRIQRITADSTGNTLSWAAGLSQQFEVQWTPSLAPPTWTALTNTITSTNGVFTFTDDGTQTGARAGARYYRLRVLP